MQRFKNTPYYVTKTGLVFRENSKKPLRYDTSTPYYRVTLCIDGKAQKHLVHRMVAETYIPNPCNKPQVNHKDLNKRNNDVTNLEWVTVQENSLHSYLNSSDYGNIKASQKASKIKLEQSHKKFSDLLGELFIQIVNKNPRNYVEFLCNKCLRHQLARTDSIRFVEPLSLLCKQCKKNN